MVHLEGRVQEYGLKVLVDTVPSGFDPSERRFKQELKEYNAMVHLLDRNEIVAANFWDAMSCPPILLRVYHFTKLVGCSVWCFDKSRRVVKVAKAAVDELYQRKRIGSMMTCWTVEKLQLNSFYKKASFELVPASDDARAFWESLNFADTRPPRYENINDTEQRIIMEWTGSNQRSTSEAHLNIMVQRFVSQWGDLVKKQAII